MEKKIQTIGVLGGSGALGSGLSYRLGKAGYQVVIGSRNPGKASEKVNEINQRLKQEKISIESNYFAAEKSDLVILAVPFSNHGVILEEIAPVVQNSRVGRALLRSICPEAIVRAPSSSSESGLDAER